MAFGTGNRSFGPNAVLYSFKIKTKDLPKPLFEVSKKVGDEYVKQPETADRVSGNLISASPKENTHDEKLIKSVNLTLQDGNDVYFVSVGYTFLGRNLLNALLALKTYSQVEISLYQSKPKPDAINKTGFASVCLRQAGEVVRGKYDNKTELPATKKIVLNGRNATDTTALDAFFEEHMKAWCKVVNAAAPKQVAAPVAAGVASAEESAAADTEHHVNTENLDEDVPF